MEAERRQHYRHCVRDNRIEIFSRETRIVGKLENISKTGLAFQYLPVRGEKVQTDTIDIIATGAARFYISGIVCRRIYDIYALEVDRTFTGMESRLCGLEFIDIENNHQLAFFLKHFVRMPIDELPTP